MDQFCTVIHQNPKLPSMLNPYGMSLYQITREGPTSIHVVMLKANFDISDDNALLQIHLLHYVSPKTITSRRNPPNIDLQPPVNPLQSLNSAPNPHHLIETR